MGHSGRTPLARFYHQAREIARRSSPEMMERLVELARSSEDDRVASVCAMAVLDRAGVKPVDFDPAAEEELTDVGFDPRMFSSEELDQIEAMLKLIIERQAEKAVAGAGLM